LLIEMGSFLLGLSSCLLGLKTLSVLWNKVHHWFFRGFIFDSWPSPQKSSTNTLK
jgi:hypothetical protein